MAEITDEQILAYEQNIREQEANQVPLVGQKEPLEILIATYEPESPFQQKLRQLQTNGYSRFRRCRGDGNCFYRAFSFLFIEYLIRNPVEISRYMAVIRDNHTLMLSIGFDEFAFVDFEQELVSLLQEIADAAKDKEVHESNASQALLHLESSMNDLMRSNAIVVYMRLLTSTYLRLHADEYVPFLDFAQSIESFCNSQVEAMDKEADEMHITALTSILGVGASVAYLNAAGSNVNFHSFGQAEPRLTFLYRPGHYDVLYHE